MWRVKSSPQEWCKNGWYYRSTEAKQLLQQPCAYEMLLQHCSILRKITTIFPRERKSLQFWTGKMFLLSERFWKLTAKHSIKSIFFTICLKQLGEGEIFSPKVRFFGWKLFSWATFQLSEKFLELPFVFLTK